MKLSFRAFSRYPLGPRCEAASQLLESSGVLSGQELLLLSRSDRRDLSREEIFEETRTSRNDRLELKGGAGSVTFGWVYGPQAHIFSQSIVGDLEVETEARADFARTFFETCREVGAFFAACDLQACFRADLDLWSRQGDVTKRLIRPYWLNFLGFEYQSQIPVVALKELGIRVEATDAVGVEIQLPFRDSGVDGWLREAVAAAWPVFVTSNSAASLPKPVTVDLAAVRELALPPSQERDIRGVLGDVPRFLGSIRERRERGVEWARQRGVIISRPRDVLLVARRFEAQVRDDQELLVDLLATYGDLIRESKNGRWSIGHALFRGEPVIRTGFLGLRASPVARDFLAALYSS